MATETLSILDGSTFLVCDLRGDIAAAPDQPHGFFDRDGDGNGYVEYERRNSETGLENQCWKDSWDSIRFADGAIAKGPIATCETRGTSTTQRSGVRDSRVSSGPTPSLQNSSSARRGI